MSRVSVSRRTRLAIMAGMIATAGLAATFSIGTANAATGDDPVVINFANTKIMSAKVHMKNEDGSWTSKCVNWVPVSPDQLTGLRASSVLIKSFATLDCVGDGLHSDTVNQTATSSPSAPWVISLETLDDDDPFAWTTG